MSHRFHRVCASVLLAAALFAQEPGAPRFDSNARLVLVPFNVQRGKYFAADLQPSDFILREDGHPREFTVFEGPNTEHPLPLELILLFDTTPFPAKALGNLFRWDPKADYEFLNNWDEGITREVLQQNGMDIRLTVYHYSGRQLERLCAATSDPREVVKAFHALLDPIPSGKGELTLLPGNHIIKPMFDAPFQGWLIESTVSALKDGAASPVPARRLLIVFTVGYSGTAPKPSTRAGYSDIVDPALALRIPVDPVIMDQYRVFTRPVSIGPGHEPLGPWVPTASGALGGFGGVGEVTGGEAFVPPHLDREALAGILGLVRDTALSQYVVGFSPDAVQTPKKHSLAVVLSSKSKGKLVGGVKDGVAY